MAAEVLLEINGHKYNALGFSYDFYQVPDFKGKPVTGITSKPTIKTGGKPPALDMPFNNCYI